jgi:hypothetical protein
MAGSLQTIGDLRRIRVARLRPARDVTPNEGATIVANDPMRQAPPEP